MITRRIPLRLAVMAVPCLVAAGLVWLLLIFAGERTGMTMLPDTAGSMAEYHFDPGGRLDVEQVKYLPREEWRPMSSRGFAQTNRKDEILWLKVTLANPTPNTQHGVLENGDYFADRMDGWIATDQGDTHLLSGEGVPAAEKSIPGREMAVPVSVPARSRAVIHLRFQNYYGAFARPVWWPDAASFHLNRMRSGLAEGIYLGGLLALLGYNALLWLRLRQKDIGWYASYLATLAAFMFLARAQLPALGFALGSPWLEKVLTFVMITSAVCLTRFAIEFLDLRAGFPRMNKAFRRWCGILALLAVSSLTIPSWPAWPWLRTSTLVVAITHVGLVVAVVASWRAGVRQARYLLLSFGCLFAGSLPMIAVWFFETTLRDVAMRGLMIGSALEMLLLSLAVADRFARAQRQLLEETEQRRAIEEAYADELEEEVRERTRELQAANADKDRMLAVIGHDLRGPLTGLMRSADGMPGEFSHGVTRTSRALLLMIEDLVLWARLKAGKPAISHQTADEILLPAAALHHSLADHAGIHLTVDVAEDLQVSADLVLAQTLIRNLLANALKFARTRVILRAAAVADGVRFTVVNDGPPLSPEVAARLLTGENEPMTATGGMGLNLCREICAVLDVKLTARSDSGTGTEFGFTLPAPHPNA
ncbi:sensor histidine kinase [Luteolibacter ambystomatis]|uniref:histidine kinase n=1 Tax=Luteolibacter ambystomatis TaxID=2824561 RepID=A0A975IY99_9BACT|nr:sensor histidine kinase [Luteolibacter ambystomatis]QUE49663.1 sensor histidine kinase [Luteolibacter ambystomatis]